MSLIGCHIWLKFRQLLCSLNALVAVFMALLVVAPQAAAQGSPFNCDVVFYQVKNTTTVSQIVKFASVSGTITPTGVYAGTQPTQLNSLGYNAVDNYMYALSSVTSTPTLVRVGASGYASVGTINNGLAGGLALNNTFFPTAGVFDAAGRYYFAGQNTNIVPAAIFRIDTIPLTGPVQVAHQYNLVPATIPNMGDFDFNGAGGTAGLLLGATGTVLYRIQLTPNNSNPALGTASVSTVTIANVGGVGSAFYDAAALKFYVFDNANSQFSQIINAESGIPSVSPTIAPSYIGPAPFNAVTGSSPTDGTSCPISGTRRADLRITKTDNITTIPTGGVTSYVITVANNGPYPANYSVVQDPAVTGLSKLSVTCSPSAGPPTPVCPATLSVASLEAGVQIITFPPTTTLTFTVNAQVTQTAGNFVTNTATITPAVDTTLITPTFTVAIDVNAVTAASTTVTSALSFCPAGTTENLTNLVTNGDFSSAAPFDTQATLLAVNTYVANTSAVSRWTGAASPGGGITQNPFSGDSARSVLGSTSWLLSNGKFTGSPNYAAWQQPVTGLVVGRTYQFMTYQSNAITVGTSSPTLPDLRLMVNQTGVPTQISASTPLATETAIVGDTWRLVQGTFTATVSAVTLSVADFSPVSATETGAVAGISQATLRACDPAADVAVTKTNGTNTIIAGSTTAYTITVANLTAGVNATNTLIVDPGVAGLIKSTITCVFTAGSSCPASLSVLGFEGAGLTIPLITATGTVTFVVFANVTGAPGTTATNIVTVSGVGYTDSNPANNQAQDADFIRGTASLSITKSNGVNTVTAGGTTSYTVTVSLTAGAQVVGAILTDPVAAGLSCTAVTCTAVIGAASCPSAASTTIAALQGAGIVLPSMSAPSSIIFNVTCGIRATGV
jgi:uncharacterized repeat protein (TIGR01451 family)